MKPIRNKMMAFNIIIGVIAGVSTGNTLLGVAATVALSIPVLLLTERQWQNVYERFKEIEGNKRS